MGLSRLQEQALIKLQTTGVSDLGVALDEGRLAYLIALIIRDLQLTDEFKEIPSDFPELYDRVNSVLLRIDGVAFRATLERLLSIRQDAETYLFCLGTLLKARLKYERILQAQPIPTVEQVGPRGLLQFGHLNASALTAFLFWRKWIFDIDNRAGQETGYLFEPILAQSLGGVAYGSKNSPVRRFGSVKGRQVDCVREKEGVKLAYELKLRVTIAASGQGRWSEELSFPQDCKESGLVPVLVVFDETPNPKLAELAAQFEEFGGRSYIGSAAWKHLDDEAGQTMGRFIDKYVKAPIKMILTDAPAELPPITFTMKDGNLVISVDEDQLIVTRVDKNSRAAADLADVNDGDPIPLDIDERSSPV